MAEDVSELAVQEPHVPQLLGHPKGLFFLSSSEAFERFSYYGMQTLLALYMTKELLFPGHVEKIIGFPQFQGFLEKVYGAHTPQAIAAGIVGLYTALVYLTPVFGGFLADSLLGKRRTIIVGALLMSAGHFLMAFDASFLLALACLVLGTGCFKGNIAAQVGDLYGRGDLRRADAFQIFYLGINGGVIAAPLVCGTLGETVGFHYGFAAAGVAMVVGLLIYLSAGRHLPSNTRPDKAARAAAKEPFRKGDGKAIAVLLLLLPVLAVGVIGNQEIFNAYIVWADKHADLVFFGDKVPTTWLITLDTIASVSCLMGAVIFWRVWARFLKEPQEITKIAIGCLISVTGLLCLAGAAASEAATGQKFGIGWLIAFHILNSIGFANVFPVSLALYSRAAPKALGSTIIGIFYWHLFAANLATGWLAGQLDKMPTVQFWLIHAACAGGAGVVFLIARVLFGNILAPREPETAAA